MGIVKLSIIILYVYYNLIYIINNNEFLRNTFLLYISIKEYIIQFVRVIYIFLGL